MYLTPGPTITPPKWRGRSRWYATPEQKLTRGVVNPEDKFCKGLYVLCVWDSALLHRTKHCSSFRRSKFPRDFDDGLPALVLVSPDDSTMQVAVKASIDDQFTTLASSIFVGRNRSANPFGSVEELLDSLGDLTMNRTLTTVAARFGPRKAGGETATGFSRSGSAFPVVGQEDKLELDDARH